MGGLPGWLLSDPETRVRCMNKNYLAAVDRYLDAVIPIIVPLQYPKGPVIAVQVENEYGAYGSDKEYMYYLEAGFRERGLSCLLFTSDYCCSNSLRDGNIPSLLPTVRSLLMETAREVLTM